jgi:hypothetical protein
MSVIRSVMRENDPELWREGYYQARMRPSLWRWLRPTLFEPAADRELRVSVRSVRRGSSVSSNIVGLSSNTQDGGVLHRATVILPQWHGTQTSLQLSLGELSYYFGQGVERVAFDVHRENPHIRARLQRLGARLDGNGPLASFERWYLERDWLKLGA